MEKEFIGFYDKNGKPLHDGDIVLAHRGYVKHDGYKRKAAPDKIRVYYQIWWRDDKPEYHFLEIGVHPDDVQWEEQYHYRSLPYFESKPERMFWKQEDGTIANQWHYDLVAHLPAAVRYLSMWEVEVVDQLPKGFKKK